MNKYIDAEKLKVLLSDLKEEHKNYKGDFHEGVVFAVDELEEDINESLHQEQPEVDLDMFDKEVTKIWGRCAAEPNDTIACLHIDSFIEIARHFYKLGLNARRE